jgi:hypothetical protein
LTEEPNVEKTFGAPIHTIPTSGEKEFTITMKAVSNGQRIMAELLKESNSGAEYHTFVFYDGGMTTIKYSDVLLKSAEPNIDKDSTITYAYAFSALKMEMTTQETS